MGWGEKTAMFPSGVPGIGRQHPARNWEETEREPEDLGVEIMPQLSFPSYNQDQSSEQCLCIFLKHREVFNDFNILTDEKNLF